VRISGAASRHASHHATRIPFAIRFRFAKLYHSHHQIHPKDRGRSRCVSII
jgi:hypothetical protein